MSVSVARLSQIILIRSEVPVDERFCNPLAAQRSTSLHDGCVPFIRIG